MAIRPIDGNVLIEWFRPYLHTGEAIPADVVIEDIRSMPTLTPPNEAPPCYQPDGDGCAYQCYDGQDEPIEKCKACPLCCSDKQRHYTPPNEWVSVEDRLPEDEKAVLAYYGFNRGDGYLGMMFQGVLTYFSCDANPHWQHEGTGLTVTHWMPLPAPPGKEDQQ